MVPHYQKMIGDDARSVLKLQAEEGKSKLVMETVKAEFPEAGLSI